MIRLTGVEGKLFVLDLVSDMEGTISLTGGISKDVDENICTLEELKYIEISARTKRVSMSGGDFTKLLTAIEDKQHGGGTAPYSSLTGNADKVLTVNDTEDGVEWTTPVTQVYVDTQDSLLQDQIDLKANGMAVNQSLTLKADLINGLIPASQLPSYVDDVLSFPDLISFPALGEDGKIYIAVDVNKTYRWGGSSYVEIGGGGVVLGETSSTAYRGDRGKVAYDHSLSQGNPHNTTTSDITEGNKLFFTESRVSQTVLTGLNTNTATPALATDQLLAAIGKLQAQINNMINTPSYPSFTGNANKVLAVKATEDGVEWKAVSSGGGSGGGINVIEYDPSLHKQATPVVNTDWIPVENTAVWDSATRVMGVGTPKQVWSKSFEHSDGSIGYCNTEYAALKLDLATLSETRSITIDAALCNDAFGFMFIPKGVSVYAVFEGRWFRGQNGSYPNESFMIFTTAQKVVGEYYFNLYGGEYINNVQTNGFNDSTLYSVQTTKPHGIYTIYRQNGLSYILESEGFATEQELIDYYVSVGVSADEVMAALNVLKNTSFTRLASSDISVSMESSLFEENMDLYLIMTPYLDTNTATFNLDPTSQIQISYDIVNIDHSAPNNAVDGDILHLNEKASISGKIISKDSFIQLYANKTKFIPLSGTVK